jgi:hypothetical protein
VSQQPIEPGLVGSGEEAARVRMKWLRAAEWLNFCAPFFLGASIAMPHPQLWWPLGAAAVLMISSVAIALTKGSEITVSERRSSQRERLSNGGTACKLSDDAP